MLFSGSLIFFIPNTTRSRLLTHHKTFGRRWPLIQHCRVPVSCAPPSPGQLGKHWRFALALAAWLPWRQQQVPATAAPYGSIAVFNSGSAPAWTVPMRSPRASAVSGQGSRWVSLWPCARVGTAYSPGSGRRLWDGVSSHLVFNRYVAPCFPVFLTFLVIWPRPIWSQCIMLLKKSELPVSLIISAVTFGYQLNMCCSRAPGHRGGGARADHLNFKFTTSGPSRARLICQWTRAARWRRWYCSKSLWIWPWSHSVALGRESASSLELQLRKLCQPCWNSKSMGSNCQWTWTWSLELPN